LEDTTIVALKRATSLDDKMKAKSKELTNCYSKLDKILDTMDITNKKYEALKLESKKLKTY